MRAWILGALVAAACGSGGGDDPDAAGDAAACGGRLDDETLASLTHSAWAVPSVELQPGGMRDLDLGTVGLGGAFAPVPACAVWSIAPAAGATIDPVTGAVQVDAATPAGSRYTVTADVEVGRKLVTADVFVYVAADMPWHGIWREAAQIECGSGAEVVPARPINEIYFWADGTLWVTWTPFEVYVDYWGTHAFDPGPGTLALTTIGGNYIPDDIDGDGTYGLDASGLVLRSMWLGSAQGATAPPGCGHRLTR